MFEPTTECVIVTVWVPFALLRVVSARVMLLSNPYEYIVLLIYLYSM